MSNIAQEIAKRVHDAKVTPEKQFNAMAVDAKKAAIKKLINAVKTEDDEALMAVLEELKEIDN